MNLRDLKWKLDFLTTVFHNHPLFMEAKKKILEERKPEIDKIKAEIEALRSKRPEPKPRWPENTPNNILSACQKYWSGTTEYHVFRIHIWNDKAVWTSYPSGGYSDNGGWHPTPVNYDLISLTEKDQWNRKAKVLANIRRRTSQKELQQILDEKTRQTTT